MTERPYFAHVTTRYFKGGWDFATYEEAVGYIRQQLKKEGRVGRDLGGLNPKGVNPHGTYVRMPDGNQRDLEALGLAARPQGPGVPDWIIF